jgi:hypothetical protein
MNQQVVPFGKFPLCMGEKALKQGSWDPFSFLTNALGLEDGFS